MTGRSTHTRRRLYFQRPKCREYALDCSLKAIDIANALDTKLIVLWLAREGTYIRETKDSKVAVEHLIFAVNKMLADGSCIYSHYRSRNCLKLSYR